MIYISTPFSRDAADFLAEIEIPAFKIGSGECDNLLFVEHIASIGKPIILSTGMQNSASIKNPIKIIESFKVDYAILECTNIYPCPPDQISLGSITDLYSKFPKAEIGFSDHSVGPEMALASVAMGATIIEKHFTHDKTLPGNDHYHAMDKDDLRVFRERYPLVKEILGQTRKHALESEEPAPSVSPGLGHPSVLLSTVRFLCLEKGQQ